MSTDHYMKLKIERDLLRDTLIDLYNVIESGEWYPDGDVAHGKQMMQILYMEAELACNRAEKVIAGTCNEPV